MRYKNIGYFLVILLIIAVHILKIFEAIIKIYDIIYTTKVNNSRNYSGHNNVSIKIKSQAFNRFYA